MLASLFRRLTAAPGGASELFQALTEIARRPHWYVEGKVPDTLDGRFAVLATLTGLMMVRLEQDGERGNSASVALTERFIQVMESEHRELGLGDPTLGRTVRKLVGSLARKTELMREAARGTVAWEQAAAAALHKASPPAEAVRHAAVEIERCWTRWTTTSLPDIEAGRLT